jgi:HPt (histidine-containing phosphotransfer) domain-containing protein
VLEEKLAVLRESYRRTLPAHLDALGAKLAAACEARSQGAWAEVAQLAHRLKGTAGSYGFQLLAAELEALEEILERSAGDETPAARAALDAALARARAALD